MLLGDGPEMTTALAATPQPRRTYDHRLREQVLRTGTRALTGHLAIPRSAVSTWRRRGLRLVLTMEPLEQGRQQTLDLAAKLDRRSRILAAVARLLLMFLRASGFSPLASGFLKAPRRPTSFGRSPVRDRSFRSRSSCESQHASGPCMPWSMMVEVSA